jgi:hypothetical protein
MSTTQTQTNNEKRSFLKTIMMSLAFVSFGGLGSIINSTVFNKPSNSKSGFGSGGYGM